jgi:hypothetical protein
MRTTLSLLLFILVQASGTIAQFSYKAKISANNITQFLMNNGTSSYNDSGSGSSGLLWPAASQKNLVYRDGILWGGYVNGQLHVGGSHYVTGLKPGRILSAGNAAGPADPTYNIWKLKKGWETVPPGTEHDQLQFAYNNWPMLYGAPFEDNNADGTYSVNVDKPRYMGDETLWFVANDLDSAQALSLFGTPPIGIELRGTEFAMASPDLQNVLFKKVQLWNKSTTPVTEMYISIWSDPDLGNADDDFIGCDSTLDIGYVYNSSDTDNVLGIHPPALGYVALQTPITPALSTDSAVFNGTSVSGFKNIQMNAFAFYVKLFAGFDDVVIGKKTGAESVYNNMKGNMQDGSPCLDPLKNRVTKWMAGDPVLGSGWYEGTGWPNGPQPGDRKLLMSFGPFTFMPGEMQELVYAYCVGKGTSNLNSISVMRQLCSEVKSNYSKIGGITTTESKQFDFQLMQNYPNPFNPSTVINYALRTSGKVTLKIYDVLGKLVETLVDEPQEVGWHSIAFSGTSLPSGVYFYRLETQNSAKTRKMLLLR